MKWKEILTVTLRRCKWKLLKLVLALVVPLLFSQLVAAKPFNGLIEPLDGGSSEDPPGYPDPDIDPL